MDTVGAKALAEHLEAKGIDRPPTIPTESGLRTLNQWLETIAAREAADAPDSLDAA